MQINTLLRRLSLTSILFITACSDVQGQHLPGDTPQEKAFSAAFFGELQALKLILKEHPDLLEKTDKHGETLLHDAARGNQPDIVRYLLKRGVPVDGLPDSKKTPRFYATPLFLAARAGDCFEAAKALIESGADVNYRPLRSAAYKFRDGTVEPAKYGPSILEIAAQAGDYRLVELLIKKRAKVEAKSTKMNALHRACFGYIDIRYKKDPETAGNQKVIAILTKYIDINCEDEHGMTPLQFSAQRGAPDTVKYLVSNYDNLDLDEAENIGGNTPLHLAVEGVINASPENRAEVIKILMEAGADVNRVNSKRLTPRQLAEKLGNKTILQAFDAAEKK